ncbi:hypothetical protein BJV74DRAFT_795645 [Russula compacta]|nr:hypothetical protein BJV74DRAFT_795645 [Russula compacta]
MSTLTALSQTVEGLKIGLGANPYLLTKAAAPARPSLVLDFGAYNFPEIRVLKAHLSSCINAGLDADTHTMARVSAVKWTAKGHPQYSVISELTPPQKLQATKEAAWSPEKTNKIVKQEEEGQVNEPESSYEWHLHGHHTHLSPHLKMHCYTWINEWRVGSLNAMQKGEIGEEVG